MKFKKTKGENYVNISNKETPELATEKYCNYKFNWFAMFRYKKNAQAIFGDNTKNKQNIYLSELTQIKKFSTKG